jgi:alpha-galactosidase
MKPAMSPGLVLASTFCFAFSAPLSQGQPADKPNAIQSSRVSINTSCGSGCLWSYRAESDPAGVQIAAPEFWIDGQRVVANGADFKSAGTPLRLANGVTQYAVESAIVSDPSLHLRIDFQVNDETSVIRFRYTIESDHLRHLMAADGVDQFEYLKTSLANLPQVHEVQLSNFADLTHSYTLDERTIDERHFQDSQAVMGPIVAASDGHRSVLLAYEHGSQAPDAFLRFQLRPDREVRLESVKGNYVSGQTLDPLHGFTTLWFESAAVAGDIDHLASVYRRFVLKSMAVNSTTRYPYVFYNTWNFQERNKWINGRPYLASMNEERILQEIDAAHRMGIDVFVLDTGWYEKTGDWTVSRARFPDGLKAVKSKLDQYNMKLGLWFGPTSAAMSSRVMQQHPEWRMSRHGKIGEPHEIWETEKSNDMCMVSGYADAFADELIRLAKEVGVSYFKWDAISQYGCDDPHHDHGSESNSERERADSYAYQLVRSMSHIADRVATAVPGTIVDFDVTEAGRSFGLAFLASGKYFLINNGPYYQNYDVPIDLEHSNWNLFFHQGPARTWIARSPLTFDKWIPSTLFLTHYFPDDPKQWQEVNVASLILGQGGIWGDLPAVSDVGIEFIQSTLSRYKQVREDMAESDPVVTGVVAGSPEIHEKISAATGRGAVVLFATTVGTYHYVTTHAVAPEFWASEGVQVSRDSAGRAVIDAAFEKPGAKILFFGVAKQSR